MGQGVRLRSRSAFPGQGQLKPEQQEIDLSSRRVVGWSMSAGMTA
jgi:transposase InsO family protein